MLNESKQSDVMLPSFDETWDQSNEQYQINRI